MGAPGEEKELVRGGADIYELGTKSRRAVAVSMADEKEKELTALKGGKRTK